MTGRGILYMHWGEKHRAMLDRSIASVKRFHPEIPIHVETLPDDSTLLDKARMFDLTPFDETLFLDTDTVVLGDLGFAFDKMRRFGLALSICECPWARRYGGLDGDIVEYNTGVLFFTRKARPVFNAWKDAAASVDSSVKFADPKGGGYWTMPMNDQAGFAKAVEDSGFLPYVLPMNWNFRPGWYHSFFGPIKIWHDYGDVPEAIEELNRYHEQPDAMIRFVSRTGK